VAASGSASADRCSRTNVAVVARRQLREEITELYRVHEVTSRGGAGPPGPNVEWYRPSLASSGTRWRDVSG